MTKLTVFMITCILILLLDKGNCLLKIFRVGQKTQRIQNSNFYTSKALKLVNRWTELYNKQDLSGVLDLYADDSIFIPITGEQLIGKNEIQYFLNNLLKKVIYSSSEINKINGTIQSPTVFGTGKVQTTLSPDVITLQFIAILQLDKNDDYKIKLHSIATPLERNLVEKLRKLNFISQIELS